MSPGYPAGGKSPDELGPPPFMPERDPSREWTDEQVENAARALYVWDGPGHQSSRELRASVWDRDQADTQAIDRYVELARAVLGSVDVVDARLYEEAREALDGLTFAATEYRKSVSPNNDRQWALSDVLWNEIGKARAALSGEGERWLIYATANGNLRHGSRSGNSAWMRRRLHGIIGVVVLSGPRLSLTSYGKNATKPCASVITTTHGSRKRKRH